MRPRYNVNYDREFYDDLPPRLVAMRVELSYIAERLSGKSSSNLKAAGSVLNSVVRSLQVAEAFLDDKKGGKGEREEQD